MAALAQRADDGRAVVEDAGERIARGGFEHPRGDADASTVVDVYTLGDFDGAAILPGSMRTVYGIRPDAVGHEYPEGNFTSNWFAGTLSEGQTFGGADADGDTMVFSLPSESPSIVGLAMVTGDKIIAFTELPAPVVSFEPQFFGYPDALVTMVPADMSESECYLEPPNRSDGESNFAGWVAVAPCDSGLVGLFRLDARVFFADDAEFPSSMFLAASALCPEGTSVAFVPSISGWEDGYRAVTCSVEL